METVHVIYHHEAGGWWAESPDVEGWFAAGDTYAEVVKLAEDGVPFALGHDAELEHCVPAGKHAAA
jgi:predicted RNase H-like HicB family nuclease